jgi:hypothetical protein
LKSEKLLLELESVLEKSGYKLRKERGSFRGADCVIEGDKLVIVNKNKPIEAQLGTIAKFLGSVDLTDSFIKPAVRKELEKLWDRLSVTPSFTNDNWELG